MKILNFTFRTEYYQVNEKGYMKNIRSKNFSKDWIFLGGSSHHWHSMPTVSLREAFKRPESLDNCLGWDKDHGTIRKWGGFHFGKLPRIQNTYITEKN